MTILPTTSKKGMFVVWKKVYASSLFNCSNYSAGFALIKTYT
jgi:hypothetical protein